MKLVVEIELGNDAFKPDAGPETARILHELADRFDDQDAAERNLFDINGNQVGRAQLVKGRIRQ